MTASYLLAIVISSLIGGGAWLYGRKRKLWKPRIIGFLLMIYPYFVAETWQIILIGCLLCVALFVFRD